MSRLIALQKIPGRKHQSKVEDLILKQPEVIGKYDLINLDFIGHFITHIESSDRVDALKKLISIQKSHKNPAFLLLLTFKAAHGVGRTKLDEYLTSYQSFVDTKHNNADEIFEWAREKETLVSEKLFILIPIITTIFGGSEGYEVIYHNFVFFYGKTTASPMVHFVFEFSTSGLPIPFISRDKIKEILKKKIDEVEGGEIIAHESNRPEFKEDKKCMGCEDIQSFRAKRCNQCGHDEFGEID